MKNRWSAAVLSCVLAGAMMAAPVMGGSALAAETQTSESQAPETQANMGEVSSEASAAASPSSPETEFNESEAESEIEATVDLDALEAAKDPDGLAADDWLPIGSVVLLNGANKTLMVMARFVYNNDDGKYYEYCGCLYPEGFGDSEYYFFNHDDIDLVAQKGYEDDYEKLYRSRVLGGLNIALLNSSDETEAETETEGN